MASLGCGPKRSSLGVGMLGTGTQTAGFDTNHLEKHYTCNIVIYYYVVKLWIKTSTLEYLGGLTIMKWLSVVSPGVSPKLCKWPPYKSVRLGC